MRFICDCDTCGRPVMGGEFTTGYGRDDLGRRHCYQCCADHDAAFMRGRDKITLYLTRAGDGPSTVTNWPGSLSFPARVRRGHHNMAGKRYDAWFTAFGRQWHGVQYGDNTQLIHCRALKA